MIASRRQDLWCAHVWPIGFGTYIPRPTLSPFAGRYGAKTALGRRCSIVGLMALAVSNARDQCLCLSCLTCAVCAAVCGVDACEAGFCTITSLATPRRSESIVMSRRSAQKNANDALPAPRTASIATHQSPRRHSPRPASDERDQPLRSRHLFSTRRCFSRRFSRNLFLGLYSRLLVRSIGKASHQQAA